MISVLGLSGLLLALLAGSPAIAQTHAQHALVDAVAKALAACEAIGVDNLEECGGVGGKSPEHSVARKAVLMAYEARNSVISECRSIRFGDCTHLANFYTFSGIDKASRQAR